MPRLTTQSDVTNPQRKGYDFRIDYFLLRAATAPTQDRQMIIQSSDVGQENAVNVKQNPEDFTTNIGRVFSRNDFTGGSNLDKAHKADANPKDSTRFWDSENIDVFNSDLGKAYNISLLNSTTNIRTFSDAANDDNYVAVVGTDIYVADEAVLYKSTNNGSSFSTVTTGITGGYTIKAMAAHGTSLYIVTSNGSASQIILYNGSSASTKLTAAIYDGIWSVKGHLVVSIGTALHDYDGVTTVASAMLTLPTGETWTDVADVGAVILATATDGRIYSIKDIAGTLTAKGQTEISGEKDHFIKMVEDGITAIEEGEFDKVVSARTYDEPLLENFDIIEQFNRMEKAYPDAFVSLVSIPGHGTWLGASPELLIEVSVEHFRTVSVAGTQPFPLDKDVSEAAWNQKEIEEQAMVSRYIIEQFKTIRLREFEESGPRSVRAGNMIHLKTEYNVNLKEVNFPELGTVMLHLLHPTSAVCGMPKFSALRFIAANEHLNREFYSGYLGPVNIDGNNRLYVNLRCMQILRTRAVLYAGAGITHDSIPEKEWDETALKCQTLLSVMNGHGSV
jgi:isochorismate synthase